MRQQVLSVSFFVCLAVGAQTSEPVYLQKNGYAKQMANVFSFIENGKLLKAEKELEDVYKKFDKDKDIDKGKYVSPESFLYPVWQISHCVMMNAKEGRDNLKEALSIDYNPWKAYAALKEATSKSEHVMWVNGFFQQRKLKYTIQSIKLSIEKNLIELVEKDNTEKAYDKLIATLYDFDNIRVYEVKRETVAFAESMKSEDLKVLQGYLDKYSSFNHNHQEMVEHRRDSFAYVQLGKNADACKRYLNLYPRSKYNDRVTQLLHQYEFKDLEQTVSACKKYLKQYPNSEYVNQVRSLMTKYAYNDAIKEGSIEAYGNFLKEYDKAEQSELAKEGLNKALLKKFFSYDAEFCELEDFIKQREYSQFIDYKPFNLLYSNIQNLITSAKMKGCSGLNGDVHISTSVSNTEYEEILVFNKRGLLKKLSNSRNGQEDSWEYEFGENGEVRLVSKTNNRGIVTTYKTKFNMVGLIAEITGSDGSQMSYTYNEDNSLKNISFYNSGKKTQIDTYNSEGYVTKSERNGVVVVYEYNYQGDVIRMSKKRGNTVMDQTTYEYEYDSTGKYWQTMRQYNNGSFFLVKHRNFDIPTPIHRHIKKKDDTENSLSRTTSVSSKQSERYNAYEVVEQMPAFPGGEKALLEFLNNNVEYPNVAIENNVQGRVVVSFVVEKDGSITEVEVVKSVDPSLDKEAVRVIKSMPKWFPGKQDGLAVRVKYNFPVAFKLESYK